MSRNIRNKLALVAISGAIAILSGCNATTPDIKMEKTKPAPKITNYSDALADMGLMTEIYATGPIKLMSQNISDNTGAAQSTGAEIPVDITEMTKSALNSIGGNVVFIPYDPSFISNQQATGYSNFEDKLIPDAVITGGITEFDRGLKTEGKSTEFGLSKKLGLDYSDQEKKGTARITLDFNMLNFQTMSGLPRMNAVNSIEVKKAKGETGMSVSFSGLTFGSKGQVKMVQGRHDATRMLVELSMIQIVGKYAALPYWRLLGDGVVEDRDIGRLISKHYISLTQDELVSDVQEWLYIYGHNVNFSGVLDAQTHDLLSRQVPSHNRSASTVSMETYKELYFNLPVNYQALARRNRVDDARANAQQGGGQYAQPQYQPAAAGIGLELSSARGSYSQGDELQIVAKPTKSGYLRCYYQDADGIVAQIFPNPYHPANNVNAFEVVKVPQSTLVGGNFAMQLSRSGATEHIACIASENRFPLNMGKAIVGPGLEALPFNSLNDITRQFGGGYAVETLSIRVN